ncbi:hypothetical protein IWW34DRAFT_735813 [Fusarium oxysporum f. sp. albedinis]|nr:hypothetical protein IWW34DRAFT_735813 [Fusarium oxysporum f. sp. albedinis]
MNTLQPTPFPRKRRSTTDLQPDSQKSLRLDQQQKEDNEIPLQPDNNLQSNDSDIEDLMKQLKITRDERSERQHAIGNRVPLKWCRDCKKRTPEKGSKCRLCRHREKEERENGPSCLTIRSVELFKS